MKTFYPETQQHIGMCDASAAVCIGEDHFVVANDEDNVLRIYRSNQSGAAIYDQDLSSALKTDSDDEVDIEGATRLGNRIYWISSHGRSRSGKWKNERFRFFTTSIEKTDNSFSIKVIDMYDDLIKDLVKDGRMQALGLDEAVMLGDKKVPDLAPKKHGSNIEGLCAMADQKEIWIGFRNPRPENKALIVRLINPEDISINGGDFKFGEPILLDLNGLGIRSIEYSKYLQAYVIVAGSHNGNPNAKLFYWSGNTADPPNFFLDVDNFNPEALLVYSGGNSIQLLSDDGKMEVNGVECKDLSDPNQKSFRSTWIDLRPKA